MHDSDYWYSPGLFFVDDCGDDEVYENGDVHGDGGGHHSSCHDGDGVCGRQTRPSCPHWDILHRILDQLVAVSKICKGRRS
mmetsp:Transcript_9979/g.11966  ORF Transcript_9979/g.11966 Transcript_9979/m.11966 type:complete len:81 (+) Transcript_9979:511-753(+)